MAVEAPAKPVYDFDDDDDDGPITFKRSNTQSSKSSQSKPEAKKPLSERPSGQSGKQVSGIRSPNGQSLNAQKTKTSSSSMKSPMRSPLASPTPSNSSARASPVMNSKGLSSSSDRPKQASPVGNSKGLSSSSDRPKQASPVVNSKGLSSSSDRPKQASAVGNSKGLSSSSDRPKQALKPNVSATVKEEKSPLKGKVEPKSEDEDSEDEVPLSVRLKGNSSQGEKGPSTSSHQTTQQVRPKTEDSDDSAPLASSFKKSGTGTSNNRPNESYEKKPAVSKIQQNGSTMKDKQQKSNVVAGKRPVDQGNSSSQSSVKKPKLSDASPTMKNKVVTVKAEEKDDEDDDDDVPLSARVKKPSSSDNKSSVKQKALKVVTTTSFKKTNTFKKDMKNSKYSKSTRVQPGSGDGQRKWTTLVHNGVIFPPPYKPHGVKMLYNGKPVDLTPEQEEVATMFAVMKETDYMNKKQFKDNFWYDWKKILGKNHVIKDLENCDFTPIYDWHMSEKEKKKQMTTEEKKALKEEKMKVEDKYMWAVVDGVKEKVGNFRVEPPGLFRGRGEHPKMGKLKRRIRPRDITINIGKDAPVPECPIPGERWGEIKHDNTVTWLAFWTDPINNKEFKYVFLAASSAMKGQSDKEKYEKARRLKDHIENIRRAYTKDFTSKDVTRRQIAVATYLIDKLALRAGNEKDEDNEADTVGCCTLKVSNVECIPPNQLKFDFLGKDSIQYVNTVEVELPVYKAIEQFQMEKDRKGNIKKKEPNELLFDELDTSKLNAHLKELMPGLTAKVFRTYNASITLDDMLNKETKDGEVAEKLVVYNRANKEVAIICNHQRSVSKSHTAQMSRLIEKIDELKGTLEELEVDLDRAKKGKPPLKDSEGKQKRNLAPEALQKKIAQTNAKIEKMERDMHTKEDLKTVALGTSKINYLDPRITVAWCKRHEVPIEKIFNKSLIAKFAWAMDVDPDFRF